MTWKRELGVDIQKARLSFRGGMSQEQLGNALGLVRNTIGNFESGRRAPNYDLLRRIAEILETDHFDIGKMIRIEFSSNGTPRPEQVTQQLNLSFDEHDGVTVRIQSAGHGVVIKKISA
jgi:transcriptional regulator with XRE-family HTH domain